MSSAVLQETQFYDKYSRYDYDKGQREDWIDTVQRVTEYLFSFDKCSVLSEKNKHEIFEAIYNKDVMPSMRNLAMAGAAAERSNICSYNCAFTVLDDVYAFREAVLILMSGTGLGYSVEKQHTSKLPKVHQRSPVTMHLTTDDNTESWADTIFLTICYSLDGHNVNYDLSRIRPAGSPLRTKGGRASGSEVLKVSLFKIQEVIENRRYEGFLRPIDVHDIMCHIARCIVSGGVRRSAMIALFDFDDLEMMNCKSPGSIENNEQRYLSNNSAVFEKELSYIEIETFMNRMFDSYAGEPGIFSRHAIKTTMPDRRNHQADFGTNPCGEIILRPFQFCNLSSVVCRPGDTKKTLYQKVKIATIIGTIQSMSDYFPGLRKIWHDNQVDERLLGVDLNGIMDTPYIRDARLLQDLKDYAIAVNEVYADLLGVNRSAAITCIKPSGNSSVMLDTSPGIHARWSDFYIRRIQLNKSNPILPVLQMYGVPTQPSNYLPETFVAEFPVKAPAGAITNGTLTAFEQLENWKLFKMYWSEHNPSCTISYHQEDRETIIEWLFENQNIISGLSFLPKSDAIYEQMPYQAITEEEYNNLIQNFPTEIDWQVLHSLEHGLGDRTNSSQVAACSSDKCII